MSTATFSLPTGFTYNDLREFLESELQEDFGGAGNYLWLRDFDDATVTYSGGNGLYQRDYTIANNDVTWGQPVEVVARTQYQKVAEMAAFSVGGITDAGDYVLRTGKIFECGNYADKNFSLTPAEAQAAVAAFAPVPNDLEHRPSILDGKLGHLQAVEMAADGLSLVGTVAIPKWLHETIGDAPLKASLAFDRTTKRIAKNGLVLDPRVADSALFGAYAEFAGRRHSAGDQSTIQAIHDHAVKAGADCAPAKMSEPEKALTFWETARAFFTGQDLITPPPAAQPPARAEEHVPMSTTTPAAPQETANEKALREEVERLRRKDIERDAAIFSRDLFDARRALPAEVPILTAIFAQALADDRADAALVTFAATDGTEQKVSRVDAVKALFAARPVHMLTAETVGNPNFVVLSAASGDKDDPDGTKAAAASATAWAERANGTTGK